MNSLAERYAALLPSACERLREEQAILLEETPLPNELTLQAHWFSGDFGSRFTTTDGREVEIIQFGTWNRGEGPDFQDCAVKIGGQTFSGPIELDSDVRDWRGHGHEQNPAFESVVLHLYFLEGDRKAFTRTVGNRNVPQVQLSLATLRNVGLLAPPLAKPGRCSSPLAALSSRELQEVLLAAARYRLRKKATRLARLTELRGPGEALFQALAEALGYKHNKLPFTLLAQRLPLKELRRDPTLAEPLLFGLGGFLPDKDLGAFPEDTRDYLRHLWSRWWPLRSDYERLKIPSDLWKFSGTRPGNHPQRRLGALTEIVLQWKSIQALARFESPKQVYEGFARLRHEYWDHHYTLSSKRAPKPLRLIGETRVMEILVNVFFPPLIESNPERWEEFIGLPAPLENRSVLTATTRLLGKHPDREKVLKSAARVQGLLQIYEDFCREDSSNCANCPFPEQLRQFWTPSV